MCIWCYKVPVASSARPHRVTIPTLIAFRFPSTLMNNETSISRLNPCSSAVFQYIAPITDLWRAGRLDWEGEDILRKKLRKGEELINEIGKRGGEKRSDVENEEHFYKESTKILGMKYQCNFEQTTVHCWKASNIQTAHAL